MNIFATYKAHIDVAIGALMAESVLPEGLDLTRVAAEPPRDAAHGHIATNAAMVLGKPAGKNPRVLAALLAERLTALPDVTEISVAGPGFINMRIADNVWRAGLQHVLTAGTSFGDGQSGDNQPI